MSSFNPDALNNFITKGGVPFRQNAISFIFDCPRCEKSDKLYIRKKDGRFVCWRCKETDRFQGRAEFALRELYNLPISTIYPVLYGADVPDTLQDLDLDLGGTEDEFWGDPPEASPVNTVVVPDDFVDYTHNSFLPGYKYLKSRGVDLDLIEYYDIRYSPFDSRVVFPIKVNNEWVGWQARYIKNTKRIDLAKGAVVEIPKVLTSNSIRGKAGRILMFQDNLTVGHCVLAEGPISAIKAHKCGGNVASMGKAVSLNQLQIIASKCKKLYIALDPDAGEDISRIVNDYDLGLELYLLQPVDGKEDLGDCTLDEVYEQFQTAPKLNKGDLVLSLGNKLGI
jgi:hypothetical protein